MGRIAYLLLVLMAVLAGCGTEPPAPAPTPPASAGPAPSEEVTPEESVIEEEDVEPSTAPGDLSDEAQAYLDEALGIELAAVAEKGERRPVLEQLPDDPSKVLTALRDYQWLSPQAKALYE